MMRRRRKTLGKNQNPIIFQFFFLQMMRINFYTKQKTNKTKPNINTPKPRRDTVDMTKKWN